MLHTWYHKKKYYAADQQDWGEKIAVKLSSVHNFIKDNWHSIYKIKKYSAAEEQISHVEIVLWLVLSFYPAVNSVEQFGFTAQEAYSE